MSTLPNASRSFLMGCLHLARLALKQGRMAAARKWLDTYHLTAATM